MIATLIKYSAPSAKARAMYGKLLTAPEWESLMEAGSVQALWDVLRKCPGWALVGQNPAAGSDGSELIAALGAQLKHDCHALGMYLNDRERESLDAFLRFQSSGKAMTPEQYQRWWKSLGEEGAGLRRLVGAEADALNLVFLLRLRRFPGSLSKAEELLIPVKNELRPPLIRQLLQAPDDATVFSILQNTHWGSAFRSLEAGDLERQYQQYMSAFSCRIMNSADPGLGVVQAFLTLKEMERCKLVRVIGAVMLGTDPRDIA